MVAHLLNEARNDSTFWTSCALAMGVALAALARAGPVETTTVAAMRLAERPNYSWTSTVADDARTYEIAGKTTERGYTWQRLPMIKSIARRLGRDAEPDMQVVFRGPTRAVIQTATGWKTLNELPRRHPDWREDEVSYLQVVAPGAFDPATGGGSEMGPWGPPVIYVPLPRHEREPPYSNAQMALCLPHEELELVVSCMTGLRVDGEIATGTLSDLGARLLLVHEAQDKIVPLVGAGTFKLWLHDGWVRRYGLNLTGILRVERRTILVRQVSNTVVSHVGTTELEVTDAIRRKLDQ